MKRHIIAGCIALVAAAGCGKNSTGPKGFGGSYPLYSINGMGLPYRSITNPDGSYSVVTGGALIIQSTTLIGLAQDGYSATSANVVINTYNDTTSYPYTKSGDTLFIMGLRAGSIPDTALVHGQVIDVPMEYSNSSSQVSMRIHQYRR